MFSIKLIVIELVYVGNTHALLDNSDVDVYLILLWLGP